MGGESLPGGSLPPPILQVQMFEYVMTGRVEARQRWMELCFEDHCRSSQLLFVGLNGPEKHLEHLKQSDQHDPGGQQVKSRVLTGGVMGGWKEGTGRGSMENFLSLRRCFSKIFCSTRCTERKEGLVSSPPTPPTPPSSCSPVNSTSLTGPQYLHHIYPSPALDD